MTGCKYAVTLALAKSFKGSLPCTGRPQSNGPLVTVVLALMKLRLNVSVRTLEALTQIDAVTVSRCVNRCVKFLNGQSLRSVRDYKNGFLIVDTTSTRVASTVQKAYSGYKHHKCAKAQVIVDKNGFVVHVSGAYPGSVHDKTIWGRQAPNIPELFERLVLANKAYAGAVGEGRSLFRPIKTGEKPYKTDEAGSIAFNKALSKIRVKIEHVFARMKSFRALQGLFAWNSSRYGEILKAVSILHNMNKQETLK